ncbi:MAG: YihY/virulence factor BrkB family protein [Candidatus Omnitrophica bacterium]|nr:YihY/virulence factor BrkB family protein [Candidatus Omnitrophota bacterium]
MKDGIIKFLTQGIWQIQVKKIPRTRSFFIKQLRIIILSVRGFNEDKCNLQASALTFYSLLSIVPVFAMAFGIAKGFGLEKMLERQLLERASTQTEVIGQVIEFSRSLLETTRGGLIAGIGVALLFWTVIKVLSNIERSFNTIWGIKKMRGFSRKFTDYLSIILICPVLIIVSGSATVFISTQIKVVMTKLIFLGSFAPWIIKLFEFLPFVMLWLLFSFIYIFMPNVKVRLSSGIISGIVAGTIYQFVQWGYINFQVGVAKYNAIYGSFSALPLFLVWMQLSWIVVLFGAEISFALENVELYEFESDCLKASNSFKRLVALSIVHQAVIKFSRNQPASTETDISSELEIPVRLARQILFELVESGILVEISTAHLAVKRYQPASDIRLITAKHVIDALDKRGVDSIPISDSEDLKKMSRVLEQMDKELNKSSANKPLSEI